MVSIVYRGHTDIPYVYTRKSAGTYKPKCSNLGIVFQAFLKVREKARLCGQFFTCSIDNNSLYAGEIMERLRLHTCKSPHITNASGIMYTYAAFKH